MSDEIPICHDLPFPRLELAFRKLKNHPRGYKGCWIHRLCLQHLEGFAYAIEINETFTDDDDGAMLPFRSGTQIKWDSHHLDIPMFAIVKNVATPIEPASAETISMWEESNKKFKQMGDERSN